MPTEDQFYEAIHQLLPKGAIWPSATEEANVNTLVRNVGATAKDLDDDATDEFDDIFPDTTTGYLDEWEQALDLPKSIYTKQFFIVGVNVAGDPLGVTSVTTPTPSTDEERRNIILSMLDNDPLNNAQFYIDLASLFGMTVTVSTGVSALQWSITVVADPGGKVALFSAMANFFKPAHTKLEVF